MGGHRHALHENVGWGASPTLRLFCTCNPGSTYAGCMEKAESQFSVKFLLAMTAIVAAGLAGWKALPARGPQSSDAGVVIFVLVGIGGPLFTLPGALLVRQIKWSKRTLAALVATTAVAFVGSLFVVGGSNPLVFFITVPVPMAFCLFESIRALRQRATVGTMLFAILVAFWTGFAVHIVLEMWGH